jgi:hypothetical protein
LANRRCASYADSSAKRPFEVAPGLIGFGIRGSPNLFDFAFDEQAVPE